MRGLNAASPAFINLDNWEMPKGASDLHSTPDSSLPTVALSKGAMVLSAAAPVPVNDTPVTSTSAPQAARLASVGRTGRRAPAGRAGSSPGGLSASVRSAVDPDTTAEMPPFIAPSDPDSPRDPCASRAVPSEENSTRLESMVHVPEHSHPTPATATSTLASFLAPSSLLTDPTAKPVHVRSLRVTLTKVDRTVCGGILTASLLSHSLSHSSGVASAAVSASTNSKRPEMKARAAESLFNAPIAPCPSIPGASDFDTSDSPFEFYLSDVKLVMSCRSLC